MPWLDKCGSEVLANFGSLQCLLKDTINQACNATGAALRMLATLQGQQCSQSAYMPDIHSSFVARHMFSAAAMQMFRLHAVGAQICQLHAISNAGAQQACRGQAGQHMQGPSRADCDQLHSGGSADFHGLTWGIVNAGVKQLQYLQQWCIASSQLLMSIPQACASAHSALARSYCVCRDGSTASAHLSQQRRQRHQQPGKDAEEGLSQASQQLVPTSQQAINKYIRAYPSSRQYDCTR